VTEAGATPAIAIGGISAEDVAAVRAAGGAGVAVVSAILGAPDPEAAAREFAGYIGNSW
jgi:thiamine-phosphate pyrophosphorylase